MPHEVRSIASPDPDTAERRSDKEHRVPDHVAAEICEAYDYAEAKGGEVVGGHFVPAHGEIVIPRHDSLGAESSRNRVGGGHLYLVLHLPEQPEA